MTDPIHWWGVKEDIGLAEIAARSAVMFLITLVLLRLAGMRPFGKGESFDKIITFLIGAIISRGVVGATPFVSTVVSVIVILLIHQALSRLSVYSKWFGDAVKGRRMVLFENGRFRSANLKKAGISEQDVLEELRLTVQEEALDSIKDVYLERTGEISFVKRREQGSEAG
ncbi:DUF421 domain-containing protein [Flavisolibacter nicotianae]|uniref:DUF421 domain-containing protein n=1 Tax=Flavisolibacter nicotianae TaxID=2364882 RepID=UPI000EB1679F|nr:YetF domain-containing protein [Flavisolibacter nicotianae]